MADEEDDPVGPTGSVTRKGRKDATPQWFNKRLIGRVHDVDRFYRETPENARVEYSRAKAERGEGRDIELPEDIGRTISRRYREALAKRSTKQRSNGKSR